MTRSQVVGGPRKHLSAVCAGQGTGILIVLSVLATGCGHQVTSHGASSHPVIEANATARDAVREMATETEELTRVHNREKSRFRGSCAFVAGLMSETSPDGRPRGLLDPPFQGDQNPIPEVQQTAFQAAVQARGSETTPRQCSAEELQQVSWKREDVVQYAIDQAHLACYGDDPFPSAKVCGKCHPGHYREWSVSSHAYAQLSPVFNAMSNTLIKVTNGTQGDFCIRCHTPVGMALNEPIDISQMDRVPAAREGVTCVVCHRINQSWGKGAGRQALVAGGTHQVVIGPSGSEILNAVLASPDKYGVLKTAPDPETRGREIHAAALPSFYLTSSAFCGACHDVFAPNGFRLEDAFSEFKASPSARELGHACADCHMGRVQGVPSDFRCEPAATIGNAQTPPRKRTTHLFSGPDYSVIHPGLFPHNPKVQREENADPLDPGLATMREWIQFDHVAGWGTDEFEANVPDDYPFPPPWQDQSRRFQARELLNAQFELLNEAAAQRHQVLQTGYQIGDIEEVSLNRRGLDFQICFSNGTTGHGVPTGFDAERPVFLRVTVWDGNRRVMFISGDLDPNGDLRDLHSTYVRNGLLPLDRQLVSLQTKFVIRNIRGGEREQVLVFPFSPDPLPYIRPETRPFTVLGRPVAARKQKQNIQPNGQRWCEYHVPASKLTGCGPYSIQVQVVAGMVPINLVHAIQGVGFDYEMSAEQIARNIVAGHQVLHQRNVEVPIDENP